MATVRLYIQETRETVVEIEVDDELVNHPAENRSRFLRSLLNQPVEAVVAGKELSWTSPARRISHVQADTLGETYEEREYGREWRQ